MWNDTEPGTPKMQKITKERTKIKIDLSHQT